MAAEHWVTIRGKHVLIGEDEQLRLRALKSHKPMSQAILRIALAQEAIVAKSLNGANLPDNEAFDILLPHDAIEVKTIVRGKHPKITIHPDSRMRKVAFGKRNGFNIWTIAVDARGRTPSYYIKSGVGSFRLSAMTRLPLNAMKHFIAGHYGE